MGYTENTEQNETNIVINKKLENKIKHLNLHVLIK